MEEHMVSQQKDWVIERGGNSLGWPWKSEQVPRFPSHATGGMEPYPTQKWGLIPFTGFCALAQPGKVKVSRPVWEALHTAVK